MTQVSTLSQLLESKNYQQDGKNNFQVCEQIVEDLVQEGLPKVFNPSNFIEKIAQKYGVSNSEARTCIKFAIKQLEANEQKEIENQDERNGACGYYYQSGYNTNTMPNAKKDGMDSLSLYSNFNMMTLVRRA